MFTALALNTRWPTIFNFFISVTCSRQCAKLHRNTVPFIKQVYMNESSQIPNMWLTGAALSVPAFFISDVKKSQLAGILILNWTFWRINYVLHWTSWFFNITSCVWNWIINRKWCWGIMFAICWWMNMYGLGLKRE